MNLEKLGEQSLKAIKKASWFPYRSGWLRDHATFGNLVDEKTYCITFSNERALENPNSPTASPYITYLEEGTPSHDIPNAFGKGQNFGIGGRFNGKFHPGSTKHKGFISDKSVKTIIDIIVNKYKGELR